VTPPRRRSRWLRLLVVLALVVAAFVYGVLPSLLSASNDLHLLRDASLWLLALAFALEMASIAFYTGLTRAILPAHVGVGWWTQLAIDLVGNGASHALPGGGATASALRYRLMRSAGIGASESMATSAMQPTISDLALGGCYIAGVLSVLPRLRGQPALLITAAGSAVVIVVAIVGSVVAARREETEGQQGRTARSRLVARFVVLWARLREHVLGLLRDDVRTRRAAGFAVANWLFDAACLWMCLWAYGDRASPGLVLTAYGFATLLGLLPLTPGGLGIVEGTLIPLLVAFGVAGPVAVLGTLTWRLFQFWLPVPAGGLCYLILRLSGRLQPLGTTDEVAQR
jgi:uncharacterized protein (TIRG00374 family)